MKKYLSLLLLAGVLMVGVFGFNSMSHELNHTSGCIASAVNNTLCSKNITAMPIHHIQAYISFFSVTRPVSFALFFLLLVTLLLSTGVFNTKQHDHTSAGLSLWRVLHDPERSIARSRKITRWLSLLENSPSLHRISFITSNLINLCKQKNLKIIKTINSLIHLWPLILSAEWSWMRIISKRQQITKVKHTTFAPSTVKITLQPIL